jgi:pilus assembly protein FimV
MAHALGLGEIELQSWLNEPLDAEISLRQSQGVNPNDVFVNVAPEAAYQRVGLERNQFLSKLRFEVVTAPDGGLAINVTSREPLREPYLNFLLELTWPSGRLMREYAVLVDPPVYAEESGLEEPVSAPSTSTRSEPAQDQRSAESSRRRAQAESSLSRRYGATETYGPTGPSDTLWSIAQQMRPDSSVSMHQMMLAIQDANPNAFIGGNINRLMKGQVLRVPTEEQIRSRSRREADRIVAQQNQEFRSPAPAESPTPAETAGSEGTGAAQPAQQAAGDGELKLLVAEEQDAASRNAEDGGSAGGDGDLPGGQDAGEAVANEELDALRRENQELDSRLNDLQDQVQTLQRLLELKDDQLAQMQGMAGEQAAAANGEQVAQPAAAQGEDAQTGDAGMAEQPQDAANEPAEESVVAQEVAEPAMTVEGPTAEPTTTEDSGGAVGAAEPEQAAEMAETVEPVEQQAVPEEAVAPAPAQPEQPQAPAQKPFPGNIIDLIMGNPLYQIALGGGLILLLLLLLLVSRRRANKEKAFFDQFAEEKSDETDGDSFDLSLDDEADTEAQAPTGDALEEAEKYLAYGQHPQAAEVLEAGISREPSRTDLRLKLLAVYAESQDSESFDKQYNELAALDDEDATAQANELRARLEEAESGPSIDDLESQLRSDTSFSAVEESPQSDRDDSMTEEFKSEEFEASKEETLEDEFGDLASDVAEETDAGEEEMEFDLSLADLEEPEESEKAEPEAASEEDEFGSIDFELESDKEMDEEAESEAGEELSAEDDIDLSEDWSSLELEESPELEDMASEFEETASEKPLESEAEPEPEPAEDDLSISSETLDDSFLEELDADLDEVAGEKESAGEPEPEADAPDLSNLDMDLSDEDLAIMDELSDSEETQPLEEEIAEAEEQESVESADAEEEIPTAEQEQPAAEPEAEVGEPEQPQPSALDLDEGDLGDDDDFDFLAGTDEAATKLDLARAYVEMGDSDGARDILEEVALEGNDEQKAEAQELLKNLS